MSLLPVCISVSSSNASSSVPNPPGSSAKASDSFRNVTLRVKKYLKLMSFASPSMNRFGSDSIGSRIAAPKLRSAPAPSCPAAMIPGPAPVMTIQLRAAIAAAKRFATSYTGSSGTVRADPNIATFR